MHISLTASGRPSAISAARWRRFARTTWPPTSSAGCWLAIPDFDPAPSEMCSWAAPIRPGKTTATWPGWPCCSPDSPYGPRRNRQPVVRLGHGRHGPRGPGPAHGRCGHHGFRWRRTHDPRPLGHQQGQQTLWPRCRNARQQLRVAVHQPQARRPVRHRRHGHDSGEPGRLHGISREDQDRFAAWSQAKAAAWHESRTLQRRNSAGVHSPPQTG